MSDESKTCVLCEEIREHVHKVIPTLIEGTKEVVLCYETVIIEKKGLKQLPEKTE